MGGGAREERWVAGQSFRLAEEGSAANQATTRAGAATVGIRDCT
jgi:hypothetical protein